MKKTIAVLVLSALAAAGVFAQGFEMSAGGGLQFDLSAKNGMNYTTNVDNYSGGRYMGFGGFLFFDAAYAELAVNFTYNSVTDVGVIDGEKDTEDGGSVLALGFTLLGKYPIGMGSFTLFPMLGADYNLVLSGKDGNDEDLDPAGDLSQFGLLAGAGLDFPFSDALYLRAEALFHLRFASKGMKDGADLMEDGGMTDVSTTFGMGPRIKVGVGYKF